MEKEVGMATDELLTAEQLADRLGVSPRTIIRWAIRGLIPEIRLSSRLRRFDYREVIDFLRAHNRGPAEGGR